MKCQWFIGLRHDFTRVRYEEDVGILLQCLWFIGLRYDYTRLRHGKDIGSAEYIRKYCYVSCTIICTISVDEFVQLGGKG